MLLRRYRRFRDISRFVRIIKKKKNNRNIKKSFKRNELLSRNSNFFSGTQRVKFGELLLRDNVLRDRKPGNFTFFAAKIIEKVLFLGLQNLKRNRNFKKRFKQNTVSVRFSNFLVLERFAIGPLLLPGKKFTEK